MNKQKLSEMRYKRVRLRPMARRIDPDNIELSQIDDTWILTGASRDQLELQNPRTGHIVPLGTDHVREYMTDIGRSNGFLILKTQIFPFARGSVVEPLMQ